MGTPAVSLALRVLPRPINPAANSPLPEWRFTVCNSLFSLRYRFAYGCPWGTVTFGRRCWSVRRRSPTSCVNRRLQNLRASLRPRPQPSPTLGVGEPAAPRRHMFEDRVRNAPSHDPVTPAATSSTLLQRASRPPERHPSGPNLSTPVHSCPLLSCPHQNQGANKSA